MAVASIVGHEAVVRKTQFPRLVIPLAVVLTSLFNLVLNLIVAFVFILAFGVSPIVDLAAAARDPRSALFVLTTAVSMIVSALYPRFRDLSIIWAVVVDGPVLRHAGALSDLERCQRSTMRRSDGAEPAVPDLRAGPGWIDPTPDPRHRGHAERPRCGRFDSLWRSLIYVVICVLAVWVFSREAPRIAEAL